VYFIGVGLAEKGGKSYQIFKIQKWKRKREKEGREKG